MAVAAPARKSAAAPAPAPSRTSPPRRKAAPAKRAPAKRAPTKRAPAKRGPAKRTPAPSAASARSAARSRTRASAAAAPATAPRRAPARTPQRARPKSKPNRAAAGQLIPLAVGHTAATVRHLPDTGLVLRMTRGRAWIAVLGALLAGIVALNVATLSFAASSGKIDEQATTLEREISRRESLLAQRFSLERIGNAAAASGLALPTTQEPTVIQADRDDVANAAARLAALGGG